jgi:hypothetical protein
MEATVAISVAFALGRGAFPGTHLNVHIPSLVPPDPAVPLADFRVSQEHNIISPRSSYLDFFLKAVRRNVDGKMSA